MTATVPDGNEAIIRQAERADLLAIYRIEKSSFPQPWPFEAFERFLGQPGFLVAAENQQVAGYIVADTVPNHGSPLGHIKDLAVHPERRGEGLGRRLLARGLSALASQRVGSVKLEVRETNEAAKELYLSTGFQPLRRIPRYYDDGEDAIIMVRELDDWGRREQ